MDRMDLIQDLILRMEDITMTAGMPRFDRVKFVADPDELWFLWDDDQRAVIVEMGNGSAEAMQLALARSMADTGDPVLN